MHQLIIGDIHGCYHEMLALIDKAGISSSDEIISLGDIVDRGPHSWETIQFFMNNKNSRCILGNHERKNIKVQNRDIPASDSQFITRLELGKEKYYEVCQYFKTLPNYLLLDEALCAHAYFEPGIDLQHQKDIVLNGVISGERLIHIEHEKRTGKNWYELYDLEKPLIVGHHNYLGTGAPLVWNDRVFCIDTGCVHGGFLTGILLPEYKIIQVQSKMDYWKDIRGKHTIPKSPKKSKPKIIENNLTHSYIKGEDLKELGVPPGPIYSTIITLLVDAQRKNVIKSKEEAINFVEEYLKNKV